MPIKQLINLHTEEIGNNKCESVCVPNTFNYMVIERKLAYERYKKNTDIQEDKN